MRRFLFIIRFPGPLLRLRKSGKFSMIFWARVGNSWGSLVGATDTEGSDCRVGVPVDAGVGELDESTDGVVMGSSVGIMLGLCVGDTVGTITAEVGVKVGAENSAVGFSVCASVG